MSSFVVQLGPASYQLVHAPSPRAAALFVSGSLHNIIVWCRTQKGWASWTEGTGTQIRYAGKIDERVAELLGDGPKHKHD
jgi:hypothetical protein